MEARDFHDGVSRAHEMFSPHREKISRRERNSSSLFHRPLRGCG
jgi:hypothetical protein